MAARHPLTALALAVAGAFSAQGAVPEWLPAEFRTWALLHSKDYASEQAWRQALETYVVNDEVIRKLNSDTQDGAEYGHTRFSDMLPQEFRARYMPRKLDAAEGLRGASPPPPLLRAADTPTFVDWRQQGAVTPVKDQASCGSCWAESAVGNIESLWYLAKKGSGLAAPIPLSIEQVIECDEHDYACYGGYPKGAYQYIIEHGGIASEADYPYIVSGKTICLANQTYNETCGDGTCGDPPLTNYCDLTCSDSAKKSTAQIASWHALPTDEDALAAYVAEHGPISVGLDASGTLGVLLPWLQFYKKGVASPRWCSTKIDHGVLIVGYGEEDGKKYWIVKNSWGEKWGEAGYFRLVRGEAMCAINLMAASASISSEAELVV